MSYRTCQVMTAATVDIPGLWAVATLPIGDRTVETWSTPNYWVGCFEVAQKIAPSLAQERLSCEFRRYLWSSREDRRREKKVGMGAELCCYPGLE